MEETERQMQKTPWAPIAIIGLLVVILVVLIGP
jgi:hypothetical protein